MPNGMYDKGRKRRRKPKDFLETEKGYGLPQPPPAQPPPGPPPAPRELFRPPGVQPPGPPGIRPPVETEKGYGFEKPWAAGPPVSTEPPGGQVGRSGYDPTLVGPMLTMPGRPGETEAGYGFEPPAMRPPGFPGGLERFFPPGTEPGGPELRPPVEPGGPELFRPPAGYGLPTETEAGYGLAADIGGAPPPLGGLAGDVAPAEGGVPPIVPPPAEGGAPQTAGQAPWWQNQQLMQMFEDPLSARYGPGMWEDIFTRGGGTPYAEQIQNWNYGGFEDPSTQGTWGPQGWLKRQGINLGTTPEDWQQARKYTRETYGPGTWTDIFSKGRALNNPFQFEDVEPNGGGGGGGGGGGNGNGGGKGSSPGTQSVITESEVTQKAEPWGPSKKYLKEIMSELQSRYKKFGGPAKYEKQLYAHPGAAQWEAYQGMRELARSGRRQMGGAAEQMRGLGEATLGGEYLGGGDPYLQGIGAGAQGMQTGVAGMGQGAAAMQMGLPETGQYLEYGSEYNPWAPTNAMMPSAIRHAARPIKQMYTEEVLPGITSQAQAQGAYGGSRHGIAQGIGAGRLAQSMGNLASQMGLEESRMRAGLAESRARMGTEMMMGRAGLKTGLEQARAGMLTQTEMQRAQLRAQLGLGQAGLLTQGELGAAGLGIGSYGRERALQMGAGGLFGQAYGLQQMPEQLRMQAGAWEQQQRTQKQAAALQKYMLNRQLKWGGLEKYSNILGGLGLGGYGTQSGTSIGSQMTTGTPWMPGWGTQMFQAGLGGLGAYAGYKGW